MKKSKTKKYKYRYFHTFNGEDIESYTNNLETASNGSYYAKRAYYVIDSKGQETETWPDYVMTSNLIDRGFHNASIRKNR